VQIIIPFTIKQASKHQANIKQTSSRPWADIEQTLRKRRANIEQIWSMHKA